MRIELSDDAEQDLEDIQLYGMEHFGVARAERYDQALDKAMGTIAEHPHIGMRIRYDSVSAELRRYECMSHTIYYRVVPRGIRIMRVLHSSMDPALHLG